MNGQLTTKTLKITSLENLYVYGIRGWVGAARGGVIPSTRTQTAVLCLHYMIQYTAQAKMIVGSSLAPTHPC